MPKGDLLPVGEPVPKKETTADEDIAILAEQVRKDETLTEADKVRIHNAAVFEADRVQQEKRWKADAHVHETAHAPKLKVLGKQHYPPDHPNAGKVVKNEDGSDAVFEETDVSGFICHDCGRGLDSDAGGERVLVCPKLHGRPHGLKPKNAEGAVECGQPGV